MSAIFVLKKEPQRNPRFFMFSRGRCFVTSEPTDMNVDLSRENSVGFLKCVVLQFFPKYSKSFVNFNVKSRARFNCL